MNNGQNHYNFLKMEKKLRKDLDEDRYQHTLGVMFTASALAMCYGLDPEQAECAGLLHDCAKCIPNDKKIRMCMERGIEISKTEKDEPYLLHSKLGAALAKEKFGIDDPDILSAITWHTTGKPAMTTLEKIVFLADYIEPGRWKAQNLSLIRQTAFQDLDYAVYLTLRDTLSYLDSGKGEIDEMSRSAFVYYKNICEEEGLIASDPSAAEQ